MAVNKEHKEFHGVDMTAGWETPAGYPAGIPNRVRVTLTDGSVLVEEVAFPPGHDKNPLTDARLATKFHGLADTVLGVDRSQAIWERVMNLDSDPRPHETLGLLTAP